MALSPHGAIKIVNELTNPPDYYNLLLELKTKIRQAQLKASLAVNNELVLLYWQIGSSILVQEKEKGGWGSKIIDQLAKDLKSEFPGMKGFSVRNLKYMRAFAEHYKDFNFVQEALAQITWYHNITLLDKVKDLQERKFYINEIMKNGWSRNMTKPIGVSEYQLTESIPENLKSSLPSIEDLENELLNYKEDGENYNEVSK